MKFIGMLRMLGQELVADDLCPFITVSFIGWFKFNLPRERYVATFI